MALILSTVLSVYIFGILLNFAVRRHYGEPIKLKARRILSIGAILAGITLLAVGCIQNPEARAEARVIVKAIESAAEDLISLNAKRVDLQARVEQVQAAVKAGEVTLADAFPLLMEAKDAIADISVKIKGLEEKRKAAKAALSNLRHKYDEPWYSIAGMIVISLLTGSAGGNLLERVSHGKTKEVLTIAREGLKFFASRVEDVDDSYIKSAVADKDNPEIELAVKEMKREAA